MMYHLTSKTTKHLLFGSRPAIYLAPQVFFGNRASFMEFPRRSFSLPPHVKLEMPNLSPTMEKVRPHILKLLGKHI